MKENWIVIQNLKKIHPFHTSRFNNTRQKNNTHLIWKRTFMFLWSCYIFRLYFSYFVVVDRMFLDDTNERVTLTKDSLNMKRNCVTMFSTDTKIFFNEDLFSLLISSLHEEKCSTIFDVVWRNFYVSLIFIIGMSENSSKNVFQNVTSFCIYKIHL